MFLLLYSKFETHAWRQVHKSIWKAGYYEKEKKNYAEISKIICIPNKSNLKLFLQIICNKLVSILRMCVWVCMQHLRECCFQCNKFCFNTEECKFFRMTNLVLQNIPPVFSLLQGNRVWCEFSNNSTFIITVLQ